MLTRRLPHTKCINASPRIRLHAFHPVKNQKKRKIIKSKVANWEAVVPKLEGFWSGEFGAGGER